MILLKPFGFVLPLSQYISKDKKTLKNDIVLHTCYTILLDGTDFKN